MLKELLSNFTVISILAVINSFIMVYLLIPKISWVIQKRQLNDTPDARSSHNKATPTMAGFSFFITLLIVLFFLKDYDKEGVSLNIIAASTLLFTIGLKDDLVLATPRSKLLIEIMAVLFMLFCSCTHVPTFYGFLGVYGIPEVLNYTLVIVMTITIINAYNLIDGIDGLASTVAIIIFSIYALIFYATHLDFYFLLCLSLIGILLAYLHYNFSNTHKIFMGDTGSLIIGFFIAVCTLKFLAMHESFFENAFAFKLENKLVIIAAILWIPLFDLFRVIGVRLLHKKNIFYPDRNHMHHILIDSGLSHFNATMLLGLSNFVIVILILKLATFLNSFIMVMILVLLFGIGIIIFYCLKKMTIKKSTLHNLKNNETKTL
ncbi:MAG: undecaprenyl/decaprenyl-phosphate alpha-N-acetylglucosaminyl 1-phosphate transferase [Flavobacteriaceae bacterium]|nr:undecaprenyl/decaprenyl-phosphate alpha-N-acetylglucosaminyl 1-phosphate transferase [Flavobacteriaceae bacterium]